MITFTKEQLSEVMCKHAEKENGLHDLLEIMLESLMVAERSEFLHEHPLPGCEPFLRGVRDSGLQQADGRRHSRHLKASSPKSRKSSG